MLGVEQDLIASAERETDANQRLAKVETLTQLLAEAVIAMARTEQGPTAPSVQAVKDALDHES